LTTYPFQFSHTHTHNENDTLPIVVLLLILSLFVLLYGEFVFMNFGVPTDTALWHAFQQLLKLILCATQIFHSQHS